MELEELDLGLYVEDDCADAVVQAALESGWLPRYRRARGALLEVVFTPCDEADDTPRTTVAAASPTCSGDAPVLLPPELTVLPFIAPDQAAPALAAHLARAHPFTDRTLARHGEAVTLLYGWVQPVPASCLIQYAEPVSASTGLPAEEAALLAQHLLPEHPQSHNDVVTTAAAGAASATMDKPPPLMPMNVMQAPSGLARPTTTSTTSASATAAESVGVPEFYTVCGELQFTLHLWSTPHTTRAIQRHLAPTTTMAATTNTSDSAIASDDHGTSATTMENFFRTRGASTSGLEAGTVPAPQASELASRDDTATVKAALRTVVTFSQIVASHPTAQVQVFSDPATSATGEYVIFEEPSSHA